MIPRPSCLASNSTTADILDTMTSLSTLCRVCHDALYAERCSLEKPHNVYVYQSHHSTLDSFLSAAIQKCFVCHIVYDNVNHQAQNLLAEARIETASTMYRIRSKGDQQGLQVVVIFLGRRRRIETKFQLLPTSGVCQRCRLGLEYGINGPAANSFTILQTLQAFASFLTFSSTQTPPRPPH